MELEIVAFLASSLSVGSSLPLIIKILRSGDTASLSMINLSMVFASSLFWILYGLMAPVYSIILWSALAMVLSGIVLLLKLFSR